MVTVVAAVVADDEYKAPSYGTKRSTMDISNMPMFQVRRNTSLVITAEIGLLLTTLLDTNSLRITDSAPRFV